MKQLQLRDHFSCQVVGTVLYEEIVGLPSQIFRAAYKLEIVNGLFDHSLDEGRPARVTTPTKTLRLFHLNSHLSYSEKDH